MNKQLNEVLDEVRVAIKNQKIRELANRVKNEKNHVLCKYRNKYPDLTDFKITAGDLQQIERLNKFPQPLPESHNWTPLEKLFYAVLWKDAKLKSIKLIIKGVRAALEGKQESPPNFVYYYLGRHLADRLKEPLVDQHTLRAWWLIRNAEIRSKFTISDAESYRRWFSEICTDENLTTYKEVRSVDSLFFAFGKYAKSSPV